MEANFEIKNFKFLKVQYDSNVLKETQKASLQVILGYNGLKSVDGINKIRLKIDIIYKESEVASFMIGYSFIIHGIEEDKIQEYIENQVISVLFNDSIDKINDIFSIMNIKKFSIPSVDELKSEK